MPVVSKREQAMKRLSSAFAAFQVNYAASSTTLAAFLVAAAEAENMAGFI